jgi:uncharacterized delta-60 repeat protein
MKPLSIFSIVVCSIMLTTSSFSQTDTEAKLHPSKQLPNERLRGTFQDEESNLKNKISEQKEFDFKKELKKHNFSSAATDSITTGWVRNYGSGLASSTEDANAIVRDTKDGSIYVAGYADSYSNSNDYLTIKYTSDGNLVWTARYNGPGNSNDVANSITLDGSGNVYVTGYSRGSGTGDDYATIKYSANGDSLWCTRYNGPGNSVDVANAMTVDSSGNVYVTGLSGGDYATIKYNTNGDSLWCVRYNGPGNSSDDPRAMAIDGSGNVYVTGSSGGDYATIKYSTNGDSLWCARYNGPGNSSDEATVIALDASGNVFVTGYCFGINKNEDYATIKYSKDGDLLWCKTYNGPWNGIDEARALALDGSGNVYVTGYCYNFYSNDYATIKYSTNGDSLWCAIYNGHYDEQPNAIITDASGSVYVTGSGGGDYATIKYSTNGDSLWCARYNGPGNSDDNARAIALDFSGNVYVTGYSYGSGTHSDCATIKYSADGNLLWCVRYNGPGSSVDVAIAIAVDRSCNVYVTGRRENAAPSSDYATLKYSTNGDSLWCARYNGPGNRFDGARAIALDSSGNVYVTGQSYGSGTNSDYTTIKYSTNGDSLWCARYNGPGNSVDSANAITVDNSGNVYVTGYSIGLGTNSDYATIKYNANGDSLWCARYNAPGGSTDYPCAIAVDGRGNVYVTGYSMGSGTNYDYATIKYDKNGNLLWCKRYNGPGNGADKAQGIAVDDLGNVYVTGYSYISGGGPDYTTIKYSTNGDSLWCTTFNGPFNSSDYAVAIALDGSGNVYVTGDITVYIGGGGGIHDYTTIKYSTNGDLLWCARKRFNLYDTAYSMALDGSGNVYVLGKTGPDGYSYGAIVKYNTNGDLLWSKVESWISGQPAATAVDVNGNIYITGSHFIASGQSTYATIKYSYFPVSVAEEKLGTPKSFVLEQNYPNPFNPTTHIKFDLKYNCFVKLTVYDILGREVKMLVNEYRLAGSYEVEFSVRDGSASGGNTGKLPSGIYFYKLQADRFVDVKKMLLIR